LNDSALLRSYVENRDNVRFLCDNLRVYRNSPCPRSTLFKIL